MIYIEAAGGEEDDMYYFEIDENGTAYRQISKHGDLHSEVSTAPDFVLCDQEVVIEAGDRIITKEQFEIEWQQAIEPNLAAWKITKKQYPPGSPISGGIAMFYPQGAIIRVSDDAYAVTDYNKLRERTPAQYLYPGYCIEGVVSHYDEINLWLVIESCKITGENSL
ncbi:hypothetical protein [Paenibacillus popilliae]|uniref:S1 motif domain-containing protein n=1 Tax=Paenibacillus popilliae TaxID=78057 RepID=A0ABY3AU37_PAEPP|nr:hypothetical protein [Paenibacillus sp. SDF0028]TQR46243.1 hypothetical protein C7Y44_00685 [Paenibacillus sp. SDF0028]